LWKNNKVGENIHNLTVKDFSMIFDIDQNEMPLSCVNIINNRDFRYRHIDRRERDKIILELIKRIDAEIFTKSGEGKKEKWEKGWGEIQDNFIESGYDKAALAPQYFRSGSPIRLFGDYVRSVDDNFEKNFVDLIRAFVFDSFLKDKDNIYEFGCGSCANLLSFCEMAPEKSYYGVDWVRQPQAIINLIRDKFHYDIHGGIFDMFYPDNDFLVQDGGVSFTLGALEQLGNRYGDFLQFLLDKPFSRHVHVNSMLEFYDTDTNLTDYIICKLENNRNYLKGFFTKLMRMEKEKIIKIIKMVRVPCGSLLGDGYSITVWEKL